MSTTVTWPAGRELGGTCWGLQVERGEGYVRCNDCIRTCNAKNENEVHSRGRLARNALVRWRAINGPSITLVPNSGNCTDTGSLPWTRDVLERR